MEFVSLWNNLKTKNTNKPEQSSAGTISINRVVSIKLIMATALCAFLLGRVVFPGETFPCAVAVIAVMMSVSTVNIYLIPILGLSIVSFYNGQVYGWGDILAVAICGLFFLFFKDVKFSTVGRAIVACTSVIIGNCFYYILMNLTYLFNTEILLKEVVAVAVFVKIFEEVAGIVFNVKLLHAGDLGHTIEPLHHESSERGITPLHHESSERGIEPLHHEGLKRGIGPLHHEGLERGIEPHHHEGLEHERPECEVLEHEGLECKIKNLTAFSIVAASAAAIAGIGQEKVVLGLWIVLIFAIKSVAGPDQSIGPAAMTAMAETVIAVCIGLPAKPAGFVFGLILGTIAGEIVGSMVPSQYTKLIQAFGMFGAFWVIESPHIYEVGIVCVAYIIVPAKFIDAIRTTVRKRFLPEEQTMVETQFAYIINDLNQKKENFRALGDLYGAAPDSRQIISYQFRGMERVVDGIVRTLRGTTNSAGGVTPHGKNQTSSVNPPGRYQVATATAGYSLEGVSGDSGLCTTLADGRIAMILSDGMGKGAAASVESKLVVTTLAKLLDSGFDVDLAMKTINAMLLTKEQSEIFATVDLALISPKTGRAKLFKMGAATTFVRHGEKIAATKSPSLPLGILGSLDLEYIDVKLRHGDVLVMVSDGVTDCDRLDISAHWLRDKILSISSKDPDTIAELIINKAAEKYGLRERDDLTVLAAVVL